MQTQINNKDNQIRNLQNQNNNLQEEARRLNSRSPQVVYEYIYPDDYDEEAELY